MLASSEARALRQNTGNQAAVPNLTAVARSTYENTETGTMIELRPGVAYRLRKFHPMIFDLVRGAWVRYVRRQNLDISAKPPT